MLSYLGEPNEFDLVIFPQVSCVFSKVFYKDRVAELEPNTTVDNEQLVLFRKSVLFRALRQPYGSHEFLPMHQNWQKLIQQDRWTRMIGVDDGRTLHGTLCSACEIFHGNDAFDDIQRPLEDRVCRGQQGTVEVCEHVALHYGKSALYVNGTVLEIKSDSHLNKVLCNQHDGTSTTIRLDRVPWSHISHWKKHSEIDRGNDRNTYSLHGSQLC